MYVPNQGRCVDVYTVDSVLPCTRPLRTRVFSGKGNINKNMQADNCSCYISSKSGMNSDNTISK